MKIRNGFVSNSSSSSFCIFGTCIQNNELAQLVEDFNLNPENEDLCSYDQLELIENMIYKKGLPLEIYQPGDWDCTYVGRSFSSIKDHETGRQFKDDVARDLETIGLDNPKLGIYEEAWYN